MPNRTPTSPDPAARARIKALAIDDDPDPTEPPAMVRAGNGWFGGPASPSLGANQPTADPTPAVHPSGAVASAESEPRDGDRAGAGRPTRRDGNGRFIATSRALTRIPPMSAALAEALLDAQAETHRVDTATRTQAVLVAAVRFGDVVRHGGGEAS